MVAWATACVSMCNLFFILLHTSLHARIEGGLDADLVPLPGPPCSSEAAISQGPTAEIRGPVELGAISFAAQVLLHLIVSRRLDTPLMHGTPRFSAKTKRLARPDLLDADSHPRARLSVQPTREESEGMPCHCCFLGPSSLRREENL